MITVTVRYFAAAAAAAVPEERVELPRGSTVQQLLDDRATHYGDRLTTVLARSSYLLDAVAVRDRTLPLRDQQVVDVLPPFAGG